MIKPEVSPYASVFYHEWKLNKARSDYNIVFNQELEGNLIVSKLKQALQRFIKEYLIFNSHIVETTKSKLHWVQNNSIKSIDYFSHKLSNDEILHYVKEPFDLNKGPLYRFCLIKSQDNKYQFICVLHHLIIDGATGDWFLEELSKYYNDSNYKSNISLQEQAIDISTLTKKLKHSYEVSREKSKVFWRKNLVDTGLIDFSFLKSSFEKFDKQKKDNIVEVSELNFHFKKATALKVLKKRYRITPYLFGQLIYAILIHKYTSQDTFCISFPKMIREGKNFIYGAHVNTTLIPYNFTNLKNVYDLIKYYKEFIRSLNEDGINHAYLPVHEVIQVSKKGLLNAAFIQTNLKETPLTFANVNASISNSTNIDLLNEIIVEQETKNSCMKFRVKFNPHKLDESLVKKFVNSYKLLFNTILEDLVKCEKIIELKNIKDYPILANEQCKRLSVIWNKVDKEFPEKTIHQIFEEQVQKTPNRIALISENRELTYKDLDLKANQLAQYLKQYINIKPDSLIALCLDRNEFMMIGILSVLKTGAAYVPIDLNFPEDRIQYILKDTSTKILITNRNYKAWLTDISVPGLTILALDDDEIYKQPLKQDVVAPSENFNVAYVIYTSGTTGTPKGVMIEHKSVVNASYAAISHRKITKNSRVLATAPYIFDSSVLELFPPLFTGGSVFLASEEIRRDTELLSNYCLKNKITNLFLVTKLAQEFLKADINNLFLKSLTIGGEKLNLTKKPEIYTINEYGPTECTVCTTQYRVDNHNKILIGSPIQNAKCYVLNSDLNLMPVGIIGELFIGGIGVGRGYLNRPEFDAKKFIDNPFQTDLEKKYNRNAKIYKTGDLVRWLPNKKLEYIGRYDSQIKIRGYRIELEEIEKVLLTYEGIEQCAVLATKRHDLHGEVTENLYLVGYYVAKYVLNETNIIEYLNTKLPAYMIPEKIIHLKNLPLTINGKLDKAALPEPEFVIKSSYIAPRNETEKKICQVWSEILGIQEDLIGISNSFFSLGGDSIMCIQLVTQLNQVLGSNIRVKDIYKYDTIKKLFDNLLKNFKNQTAKRVMLNNENLLQLEIPLSPIQEWFFNNQFFEQNHWNQAFLIKVPNLNINRLKQSINKLIKYHDSFRIRFKATKKSNFSQYYNSKVESLKLKLLDIRELDSNFDEENFNKKLQAILTSWQANFDIEKGPIYSIGYIHGYKDGSARVFFALHHLIVDTVSWRILVEDLQNLYYGKELAPKGSSYGQWVRAIQNYNKLNQKEKIYWQKTLSNHDKNFLQKQISHKHERNYGHFIIEQEKTKKLLRKTGNNSDMQLMPLFLAILGHTVSEILEIKTVHLLLEGHGREDIDPNIDVTRTLGWFTSMFPLCLDVKNNLKETILGVTDTLRKIPHKGIGYGALVGYKNENLPAITFNYLGQFGKGLESQNFNKTWTIVNENSGILRHPNNEEQGIINILAKIIDNRLEFHISTKLGKRITTKITELINDKLDNIISHLTYEKDLNVTDYQSNYNEDLVEDDLSLMKKDINDNIANIRKRKSIFHDNQEIKNILITGATGFLGRYLLVDLLKLTKANIYCLIRPNQEEEDVSKRLNNALYAAGLKEYLNHPRIICLKGDLNSHNLGLGEAMFENLTRNIDSIYHCASNNHHLLTYRALRDSNVLGTLKLLKLSISKKIKQFHYISTINTVIASGYSKKRNPKINFDEPGELPPSVWGYVQSKWVCEKILWAYIRENYPFYIYRPGNITGDTLNGFCMPEKNHSLLLLKGFMELKKAPKWQAPFEIGPVDIVSKSIADLSLNTHPINKNVFNIHNTDIITWENYIKIITKIVEIKIEFLPNKIWIKDILNNISRDNSLYFFQEFYANENDSSEIKNIQFMHDSETLKLLEKYNINYPQRDNYDKILEKNIKYLLKSNFIKYVS